MKKSTERQSLIVTLAVCQHSLSSSGDMRLGDCNNLYELITRHIVLNTELPRYKPRIGVTNSQRVMRTNAPLEDDGSDTSMGTPDSNQSPSRELTASMASDEEADLRRTLEKRRGKHRVSEQVSDDDDDDDDDLLPREEEGLADVVDSPVLVASDTEMDPIEQRQQQQQQEENSETEEIRIPDKEDLLAAWDQAILKASELSNVEPNLHEMHKLVKFIARAPQSSIKDGSVFPQVPHLGVCNKPGEGFKQLHRFEALHRANITRLRDDGSDLFKNTIKLLDEGYHSPRFDRNLINRAANTLSKAERDRAVPLAPNTRCYFTNKVIQKHFHRFSLFRDSQLDASSTPEVITHSFHIYVRDSSNTRQEDLHLQGDTLMTILQLMVQFYDFPRYALLERSKQLQRIQDTYADYDEDEDRDWLIYAEFVNDQEWWVNIITLYLTMERILTIHTSSK